MGNEAVYPQDLILVLVLVPGSKLERYHGIPVPSTMQVA